MKKIVDILTVLMLAAAFIVAYYTGFVSTNSLDGGPVLATSSLAIISILGIIVLFVVGTASSAVVRAKKNAFTKSFTGLFIAQAVGVIGMITLLLFVLLGMFPVTNTVVRMLYIVFAMTGVVGYVDALLYADAVTEEEAVEEVEDTEETEEALDEAE